MANEVGFLKSAELFETTMDERYNHGDGKNSLIVVARDQERSLVGCFGHVEGLAQALAGASMKDDRMKYIIMRTAKYIIQSNPMDFFRTLSFLTSTDDEDDDDD